jgi:hypothetical protein
MAGKIAKKAKAEIQRLKAEGKTTREIADILGYNISRVAWHYYPRTRDGNIVDNPNGAWERHVSQLIKARQNLKKTMDILAVGKEVELTYKSRTLRPGSAEMHDQVNVNRGIITQLTDDCIHVQDAKCSWKRNKKR